MKGREVATRRSTELSTHVRSIEDLVEEFDDEALKEQTKSDADNAQFQDRGTLTGNDILRPCPPRKGTKLLYREATRHWVKDRGDGKGGMITCVAKMKAAGRCYYCEAVAAGLRSVDPDEDAKTYKEISSQKGRSGAYWNCIDMKAPERGAKPYWFPFTVHKDIKTQCGLIDGDVSERPWSISDGFPIKITRDAKNEYSVRLLRKKAEELDPECYLGMADLEKQAAPPTPQELFAYAYTFAKNYGVLDEVDWDDVPYMKSMKKKKSKDEDDYEFDDEYERPPKKRAKVDDDEDRPVKKKRTVEDDDEDDRPVRKKAKVQVDEDEVEVEIVKPKKKRVVEDDDDDAPPSRKKAVDVTAKRKKPRDDYDASDDPDPFGEDD